ncbi:MAG: SEC-C domain-containing protein [Proteobacteria bacterium]|nr:SEC-C domain-containing protein [Pseudomonadota bacterium]
MEQAMGSFIAQLGTGTTRCLLIKATCPERPEYYIYFAIQANLCLLDISQFIDDIWMNSPNQYSHFLIKASKIVHNNLKYDEYCWCSKGYPLSGLHIGDIFYYEFGIIHKYSCMEQVREFHTCIDSTDDCCKFEFFDEIPDKNIIEDETDDDFQTEIPEFKHRTELFTRVQLEVLALHDASQKYSKGVHVLDRNELPAVPKCELCGKPSTTAQIYRKHVYLCDDCINTDDCPGLPIINSPRCGINYSDGEKDHYINGLGRTKDYNAFLDKIFDDSDEIIKCAFAACNIYGSLTLDEVMEIIRHYYPDCTYSKGKVEFILDTTLHEDIKYDARCQVLISRPLLLLRNEKYEHYASLLKSRNKRKRNYVPRDKIISYYDIGAFLTTKISRFLASFIEKTQYYKYFNLSSTSDLLEYFWSIDQMSGSEPTLASEWFLRPIANIHPLSFDDLGKLSKSLMEFSQTYPIWEFNGLTNAEQCAIDSVSETDDDENPYMAMLSQDGKDFIHHAVNRILETSLDQEYVQPVWRNDPCPCGSGKKYKHCHGKK